MGSSARRDGLAAPEGVDEGSADAVREGTREARDEQRDPVGRPDVEHELTAASPGPLSGAGGEPTGRTGTGDDLLGEPPHGAPVEGEQSAAPDDMESQESRAARAAAGPGQQLEEGEG